MASMSFVSNGYHGVYAATDFPGSELGTKIRESIKELFPASPSEFSIVKITLSGFPGQTGESVTNVGLTPSPCRVHNDITCTGFSHIVIPGIGEGSTSVFVIPSKHDYGQPHLLRALVYAIGRGFAIALSYAALECILCTIRMVTGSTAFCGVGGFTVYFPKPPKLSATFTKSSTSIFSI
jgi:hypothetical protein